MFYSFIASRHISIFNHPVSSSVMDKEFNDIPMHLEHIC